MKEIRCSSIEEYVDLVFNYRWFVSIKPRQIKEEIIQLLKYLKKRNPRAILEIGTADGGTLYLLARIAAADALIISIDLPESMGGYEQWRETLYRSFERKNQKIQLIRGDSHDLMTFNRVKEILDGKKLDVLLIDGDHSYIGVKKDFEMYSKLLSKNGVIIFHDIVKHPQEKKCEVDRFWNEIKSKWPSFEIISSKNQRWAGIGVITHWKIHKSHLEDSDAE